ncbi:putative E3 ubiquitin-protein ligase RING1a isoform X1 [Senna tora]|uniref:Putative E3 ubiquitin-protein ligase RING1a isoform X1 n=1 Tax=Senna tora TaxID=362788 RepID=A0A834WN55_9FABA|nr:putative E3 ubiquitin-protein ligase RING1a isoform X1 [Senna tora]
MPAQKRSIAETLDDEETSELHLHRQAKQSHGDRQLRPEEQQEEEEDDEQEEELEEQGEGGDDEAKKKAGAVSLFAFVILRLLKFLLFSCQIPKNAHLVALDKTLKARFMVVELPEVHKDVQCPICLATSHALLNGCSGRSHSSSERLFWLGIIKKTRTVMECLHRFCRECIDKSMRLGNNECPACRTHCASRRSLRDDPNYDAIIAALCPNIEKYEEEELEFREEDKTRNKQVVNSLNQASIAQVFQRQTEAMAKRRSKDTPGASRTRSQRNQRSANSRRQNQDIEEYANNEEENDNNGEKNLSSSDEQCTEPRQRRQKRQATHRSSQPFSSMAMASADGGSIESDMDIRRENGGLFSSHMSKPRKFTWGRGGSRSHTRHGSGSSNNSKNSRSSHLSKLVDYLRSLDENTDEIGVHLMLVSLDKESAPRLQQPHLCCQPTLSVRHLCEYVAHQTPLPAEEVQILAVKGCCSENCDKSADETMMYDELTKLILDPCKDELEILQGDETLAGLKSKCISKREHLNQVQVQESLNTDHMLRRTIQSSHTSSRTGDYSAIEHLPSIFPL